MACDTFLIERLCSENCEILSECQECQGICEVNKFNEIFSQSSESKILGRVRKCFHVKASVTLRYSIW